MNRIKELRNIHGIKQNDLCAQLDVSQGTLSGWENGKYEPDLKSINRMCDIFGTTTDYLLGRTNFTQCNTCYRNYDPLNKYDSQEHTEFHQLFLDAEKRYGNILSYSETDKLRSESISRYMKNGSMATEERLAAFEDYLKYDYMQYLWRNNLSLNLEKFETYCKKEIGLASTKEALDERDASVYPKLVEKYGVLEDEKYHKSTKSEFTARDERDIKKDLESLRAKLTSKELGPAAFDGEDIPEDDTDLFLGQVELMLRRLKAKNKEKYNPHKNKK